MKYLLILILSGISAFNSNAQYWTTYGYTIGDKSKQTTMSIIEFLDILENRKDSTVQFINVELSTSYGLMRNSKYWRKHNGSGSLQFNTDIHYILLDGCTIPWEISFTNSSWHNLIFNDCDLKGLHFKSCILDGCTSISIKEDNNQISPNFGSMRIENCQINGSLNLPVMRQVHVQSCTFNASKKAVDNLIRFQAYGLLNFEHIISNSFISLNQLSVVGNGNGTVKLFNNTFNSCLPSNKIFSIDINGTLSKLEIDSCSLQSMDLSDAEILDQFSFSESTIKGYLFLDNVTLPSVNSNIPWSLISKTKIALLPKPQDLKYDKPYTGFHENELDDLHSFNDLLSEYKLLLNIYKIRGERKSANGCFIRMKDLETAMSRANYVRNESRDDWFDWRFNQFMKLFSDYGTNPVKSLLISFYVILSFAGLYFLFHRSWNSHKGENGFKKMVLAFANEDYSYEQNFRSQNKETTIVWKNISKNKSKTGSIFPVNQIGYLIYCFQFIRVRWIQFVYSKIDEIKTHWDDTNREGRFYRFFLVTVIFIFGGCFFLLLRLINALALSLNTFSTLGFGRIPVHGGLKYVTILEGFAGWFLLSIFTTTIVNQLIQG